MLPGDAIVASSSRSANEAMATRRMFVAAIMALLWYNIAQ